MRAFLTLVVTQCSHITLGSRPAGGLWKVACCTRGPSFLPPVIGFSHFHTGVKSVLHWVHSKGSGGGGIAGSLVMKSTTCSRPTKYINSVLDGFGTKCISGGGGFGGGICNKVFSSCFLKANLAAAWRCAGVWLSSLGLSYILKINITYIKSIK